MSGGGVEQLLGELIAFNSVSANSNLAISEFIESILVAHGFAVEHVDFRDPAGVQKRNLVAVREPIHASVGGGLVYSAHNDVVPADDWIADSPGPFAAEIRDGKLFGRGACDMKGSLAAALTAMQSIHHDEQTQPLYFVLTADEEVGMVGAKFVAERSELYRLIVERKCRTIVGEPTSLNVIYAHKGSLLLSIYSRGESAHSSSSLGCNANDRLFAALPELTLIRQQSEQDAAFRNSIFEPPTLSWNWVVRNEPFASNVKPGLAELRIFLRPMPAVDHCSLAAQIETVCNSHGLEFAMSAGTAPMAVDPSSAWVQQMLRLTQTTAAKTACYATDGGVFSSLRQMVVCGPGDVAQAHSNHEWISLEQLNRGVEIYRRAFSAHSNT